MIDGAKSLFSMKLKQLFNHDSCGVCAIVNPAPKQAMVRTQSQNVIYILTLIVVNVFHWQL